MHRMRQSARAATDASGLRVRGAAIAGMFLVLTVWANAGTAAAAFDVFGRDIDGGIERIMRQGDAVMLLPARLHAGKARLRVSLSAGRIELSASPPPTAEQRPPDILPDGIVSQGGNRIRRAWIADPTRRYGHGVLGDAIEGAAIVVEDRAGASHSYRLPADSVFEDRIARLVDVDGDGNDEVLIVRSYLDAGSAAMLLRLDAGGLRPWAEAAPIGRRHRWLNPVGVADFDGDGTKEVAVVVTPHINGLLRIYAVAPPALVPKYEASGFSNHDNGSRELGMSAFGDALGDGRTVIALPTHRRHSLRLVTFAGGEFADIAVIAHRAEISTAIEMADLDGDRRPELVYGLRNGRLIVVRRK